MTVRFKISEIDCVIIDKMQYVLHRQTEDGIILRPCDGGEAFRELTHSQLCELFKKPGFEYRRGYFSSPQAARRLRNDTKYMSSLPQAVREKVLWKESYCIAFRELEAKRYVVRTLASIGQAIPRLADMVDEREAQWQKPVGVKPAGAAIVRRLPPSASTLRAWLRLYDRHGFSPLAFLRKNRGHLANTNKLGREIEMLLAECVAEYLVRNEPTQAAIIEKTHTRFNEVNRSRAMVGDPALAVPSARTIRRRIMALDAFEVVARRKGHDAARRQFAIHENGAQARYPMERIEMDEWNVDVISLFGKAGALDALDRRDRAKFEIGRRWIYVAIDCATRCVVSFTLVAKPSGEEAVRALSLIPKDKTPIAHAAACRSAWDYGGGIGSIVTDQGSAFTSVEFRTAVCDLFGTYEAPPAGIPKLRGTIERIFGTFGAQLAPYLIGRTFSNPQARGDYPSELWAALTDDELAEIFVSFIVDIYHNTPHSGLQGETPANAWKRLKAEQGVTPPPDSNAQRVVFGIPLERKIERHGVSVYGINYSCPALQTALLRGHVRKVSVRVDPHDISYISVCVNGEWCVARAVSEAVGGLSLADWKEITFNLRDRHQRDASLTEEIIWAARKRIVDIDRKARELARVLPDRTTAKDIERLEEGQFLGLQIKPGASDIDSIDRTGLDLLGDVIAADTPQDVHVSQTADGPDDEADDGDLEMSDD